MSGLVAEGAGYVGSAIAPSPRLRRAGPATNGVVVWCLSLEDLVVSKALAGREKDLEFCRSLLNIDAVGADLVRSRVETTDVIDAKKNLALGLLPPDS